MAMSSDTDSDHLATHTLYDGPFNGSNECLSESDNETNGIHVDVGKPDVSTERRPSSTPILDILSELSVSKGYPNNNNNSIIVMSEDRHAMIRNLQEIPIREEDDHEDIGYGHNSEGSHHHQSSYAGVHHPHPTSAHVGNAEIRTTTMDSDGEEEDESNSESEKVIFGLKKINQPTDHQPPVNHSNAAGRNQTSSSSSATVTASSNKNLIFNPFSPPATDGEENSSASGFMRGYVFRSYVYNLINMISLLV